MQEEKKNVIFITEENKKGTAVQVLQQCPFVLQKMVGRGQGKASGGDRDRTMESTVFDVI